MQTILIVFHLFLAVGLIGLILIQHGKGADMGAAFGSGASGTVFGSKGSASFLTRLTAGLATLFFITSMVMAYFATQRDDGSVNILEGFQQSPPAVEVEAVPQGDVPAQPAATDMPPVPEPAGQATGAPAENADMSAVPVPETGADVPAAQTSDTAPAETTAQPAETKE